MASELLDQIQQALADVQAKDAIRLEAAQALDVATKSWQQAQATLAGYQADLNALLGPLLNAGSSNITMSA